MSILEVNIVKRFADCLLVGKLGLLPALMHEDCVVRESPALPYGGDYVGPRGMADLAAKIFSNFEMDVGSPAYIDAGERVLIMAVVKIKSKISGRMVDMPLVEIYRVADGRIVDGDIYYKSPGLVADLHRAE